MMISPRWIVTIATAGLALTSAAIVLLTGSVAAHGAGAPPRAPLTLTLPARPLPAGEIVQVRLRNQGDAALELALCPLLARWSGSRWVTITRTHGVDIGCGPQDPASGEPIGAHRAATVPVTLYDDLIPGTYRVALPYRRVGTLRSEPPFTTGSEPQASVILTVTAFVPPQIPPLSAARLDAIALRVARQMGDGRPSLIQVASGTRFMANLEAGGDLVFAWNPSYLIAMRGHFSSPDGPPIPSPAGVPLHPDRWTVQTLVVDAVTGDVTDSGGSHSYPRMTRLENLQTLPG